MAIAVHIAPAYKYEGLSTRIPVFLSFVNLIVPNGTVLANVYVHAVQPWQSSKVHQHPGQHTTEVLPVNLQEG